LLFLNLARVLHPNEIIERITVFDAVKLGVGFRRPGGGTLSSVLGLETSTIDDGHVTAARAATVVTVLLDGGNEQLVAVAVAQDHDVGPVVRRVGALGPENLDDFGVDRVGGVNVANGRARGRI
jgi:hypothetical protein